MFYRKQEVVGFFFLINSHKKKPQLIYHENQQLSLKQHIYILSSIFCKTMKVNKFVSICFLNRNSIKKYRSNYSNGSDLKGKVNVVLILPSSILCHSFPGLHRSL